MKSKPGYKSTEFWMSLAALIMTGGMGMNPELVGQATTYIPAAVAGVYTMGRSLYKAMAGGK